MSEFDDIYDAFKKIFPYPWLIFTLFAISVILTVVYIILSLRIMKQENEEKGKQQSQPQQKSDSKKNK